MNLKELQQLEKEANIKKLEALDKLNLKELFLLRQDCAKRDSDE